jgi:hypothetical protein
MEVVEGTNSPAVPEKVGKSNLAAKAMKTGEKKVF